MQFEGTSTELNKSRGEQHKKNYRHPTN